MPSHQERRVLVIVAWLDLGAHLGECLAMDALQDIAIAPLLHGSRSKMTTENRTRGFQPRQRAGNFGVRQIETTRHLTRRDRPGGLERTTNNLIARCVGILRLLDDITA